MTIFAHKLIQLNEHHKGEVQQCIKRVQNQIRPINFNEDLQYEILSVHQKIFKCIRRQNVRRTDRQTQILTRNYKIILCFVRRSAFQRQH